VRGRDPGQHRFKDLDEQGEPVPGAEHVITIRTPDERLVLLEAVSSRSAGAIKAVGVLKAGWGIATSRHRDWKDGKNHPGHVLARRLRDKAGQVWLWCHDLAVPFTNNASGRALKNARSRSGGPGDQDHGSRHDS
jgi:hypothetical protein